MADVKQLEGLSVDELLKELRARGSGGAARGVARGAKKGAKKAAKKGAKKGAAKAGAKAGAKAAGKSRAGDGKPDLSEFDSKTIARALKGNQKVIYGTDDRVDVFQLPAGANRDDVDSVVALFRSSDVTDNGDGTSTLQTQKFATAHNLCASERFREQPIGAFCSGFLVAADLIATAGHCADDSDVTDIRFVFGFRMKTASTATTKIQNSEIYRGVKIVGRKLVGDEDWAVVRIDRPVTNHRVVKLRRTGKIADGQALHVIGHPVGLPTKFAGGAVVRDNTPTPFFVANLDTYGGNSGSPVFNSNTHEVEGILVRGETDFVSQGSCNVSLVCPSTGCRGEDVTRATEFAKIVAVTSVWPTTGKAYFFKGSQYQRYDLAADKVDTGYPKPISGNWPGFPATFASGVNAYAIWTNGKAYFFKGTQYIRYDVAADKVDSGYPKPISGNWPGVFTSNIDAAIVWPNGKAYFFKGSQYQRYDLAADKVDTGYPKPISGNWPGFPAAFASGINAVVMWPNGKAYFFKGSEYIRYDVATDKVDSGYPKPISGNWPGLFTSNIDA
ncbi:MAG TPA: hemopexin repeat-containing protein [Pyrinomonadaceae bacterium]|nr:hemopexin repeat-containing protein [Pyrinomonadaceae bacterium]